MDKIVEGAVSALLASAGTIAIFQHGPIWGTLAAASYVASGAFLRTCLRFKRRTMLYGKDVAKWEYLGHSTATYTNAHDDSHNESIDYAMFIERNGTRRCLSAMGNKYKQERFLNHPFFKLNLQQWQAGEGHLSNCIAAPSEGLKARLKKEGYRWDRKASTWKKDNFEAEAQAGTNVIKLTPKK